MFLLPAFVWAGDKDDFGIWMELGAQKALPHNLSVGLDAELRSLNNGRERLDRVDVGIDVGYKLNKYVKFGLAYDFIESYKDDKTTINYKSDDETIKNVKVTPSYWRPRHRLSLEVTPSIKLCKMLRISVRERYQYTHQKEQTLTRYKYKQDLGTGEWTETDDPKEKAAKDTHILRSRLKLEIDKKRLAWSPFVSVETQNRFNHMNLRSVRTAAGTEYKINKHNSVSMAYVFTYHKEDKERMHAISVGYNFKF